MATTKNYKRLRLEDIEKTVELETEKFNKEIGGIERSAINMVTSGLLFYQSQSRSIGETSVLEFLRSFPAAVGGGLWFEPHAFNNETRKVSIYAFYDRDTGELRLGDIENYDFYDRNWYRDIVDEITQPYQVAWAKPFIGDITQNLKTAAGAGIFDSEGAMIGISVVDWGMEKAVKALTAIRPTENSFVVLCVPEKDYIISATYLPNLTGAPAKIIPWDINAGSFTLGGVNYLNFGRRLDNGWLLSVQIPENEIFAEVEKRNTCYSMTIIFSLVFLMAAAYFLVSKLINTPLRRLTTDVAHLAIGNLDMHVKETTKDEFGMLAGTFNKMTEDLKNAIEAHEREREEKKRIATELRVAAEIQSSMIPCIFPAFPTRSEFDIYATMIPAREVGGDFYDFYMLDRNNLAVVIADVSGKGIPAALFMVITKTIIRDCTFSDSPKSVFEIVNKKLCENNDSRMFVTAIMGIFNIPSGRFVYVNAGHTPPLLRRGDGDFNYFSTKPCIVLGFIENPDYREVEIMLEPGDAIYFYTDGVTEAMNADRELFSEKRLLASINRCKEFPPKDMLSSIKRDIDIFTGETEQSDDITMLALEKSRHYGVLDREAVINELTVVAKMENFGKILDFIGEELDGYGYPPELEDLIFEAVEEIFVNVEHYAYAPETGEVTIGIAAGDEILIRFVDNGRPYNPLEAQDPDLDKPLMQREIGGLGIFLVKKLMDTVNYHRMDDKNVLIMTKKVKK
ncbi:MAG: SpoIIE family protein phosphatase [Treponema sp.]|nr:SpoIIE family protein phosphatase [Treponema sp.]